MKKTANAAEQISGGSDLMKRIKKHKVLYLFLLPAIVWLLIFAYWPMYGALLAFKGYKFNLGILGSPWVGLKHFSKFLKSSDFWRLTRNTLIISLLKFMFSFPAPIILALMLNEMKAPKYKSIVQTMSYLPNFVSWVVVVQLMTLLLSPYGGLLNNIRKAFGYKSIFYMGEKKYFYFLVVVSNLWKTVGWGSIVYLSALSSIDPQLYEAAAIDGASRLKLVWHVTLPGIKGTVGIMLILSVGNLLNAGYDQILLLQQPANMELSEVLDTFVVQNGIQKGRFEYATAIGLFKSLFSLIVLTSSNTFCKKKLGVSLY